jgi:hypothetical protein
MIQINLFTAYGNHYKDRFWFTKMCLDQFSKIKKNNLEKVNLHVYINALEEQKWVEELTNDKYENIDIVIQCMNDDEYIHKVELAHKSEFEYSCKWDDDTFINSHVWDYIIENVNILDQSDVSVLIPIIQNGIPTVDFFIDDFLNEEQKNYFRKIFLTEGVKNNLGIWGCNYNKVQQYIENQTKWDYEDYWKFMDGFNPIENINLPAYMQLAKGFHPARFSHRYNMEIAKTFIQNQDLIFNKRQYSLMHYNTVYFCNNLTFIKTEFWKESQSTFKDGWDEGQMNVYSKIKNMHPVYVRNSCGIHMAYGCTEGQKDIEQEYINNLCKPYFNK